MAGYGNKSNIHFKLEGADKIKAMVKDLPAEVRNKVIRTAGIRAMKPLREAARQNIQKYAGRMKNTAKLASMIVSFADTTQKDGSVVTGPKRTGKNKFWFAHFIEFGVKGIGRFTGRRKKKGVTIKIVRKRKSKQNEYLVYDKPGSYTVQQGGVKAAFNKTKLVGRVRYRKDQPAMPFMEPAFASTKGRMISEYATELRTAVIQYWKKKGSK